METKLEVGRWYWVQEFIDEPWTPMRFGGKGFLGRERLIPTDEVQEIGHRIPSEDEVGMIQAFLIEIRDGSACHCHEAWTSRKRHDPACPVDQRVAAEEALKLLVKEPT